MKTKGLNPSVYKAFEQAVRHMFDNDVAFNRLLGLTVLSLDPERTRVRFDMRPELIGNFVHGQLHGGVICSALDVVAGLAIMVRMAKEKPQDTLEAQLGQFRRLGTIDLRIDFLRPGKGAHFVGTAQVMRLGSRVASVRMDLENDSGELIASGAASFMVG